MQITIAGVFIIIQLKKKTINVLHYSIKSIQKHNNNRASKHKYQIHLSIILHCFPIFLTYDKNNFLNYRDRYIFSEKLGYYNDIPKNNYMINQHNLHFFNFNELISIIQQLIVKSNNLSVIVCMLRIVNINKRQKYQKSSILNGIPDCKNINEKEDFESVKKNLTSEIIGLPMHNIYWSSSLPIFVNRQEKVLERGVGVKLIYFHATHLIGTFKFDSTNKLFSEYAWIPKGRLSEFFNAEYFKKQFVRFTRLFSSY